MLTFSFTGVDGTMTECETLTSGMVGKTVQLLFDDSWDALRKTVVFRAADVNRVVIDPESSIVAIPEAVLARPFGKLFVGVYGTDEAGTVVIPTVMAEGPMIRYGADPMEDETAKALPVWENLQNQIGDLAALETEETGSLTAAVNELHRQEAAVEEDVAQLQEEISYLGEPMLLETSDKTSLVGAVNEVSRQTEDLAGALTSHSEENAAEHASMLGTVSEIQSHLENLPQTCLGLTSAAAQLLVDILSKGTYSASQENAIAALAAAWGVTVPEEEIPLIYHWDLRTGSLTDLIAGATAVASSATFDAAGAHLDTNTAYIMFPAGVDGATLSGNVMEIKFGEMALNSQALSLRLAASCAGAQPATSGISWTTQDCWSSKSSVTTEFTDLDMFSGKTLYAKGAPDSYQIDWYCEDQLICSSVPTQAHSHISIGSTSNGAHPVVVEYVKVYPAS